MRLFAIIPLFLICFLLTLLVPGAAIRGRAQDQPPPLTSPKGLRYALDQAASSISKSIDDLNARLAKTDNEIQKTRQTLQELKIESASVDCNISVQSLSLPQLEDLLKGFTLRKSEIEASVSRYSQEAEQVNTQIRSKETALDTLKANAEYLRKAKEPEVWSKDIQSSFDTYVNTSETELGLLRKVLNNYWEILGIFQEQKEVVDDLLVPLQEAKKTGMIEFLKHQTHIPLTQRVGESLKEIFAQPEFVRQWLLEKIYSGRAWDFVRGSLIPFAGLLFLLGLWRWVWHRFFNWSRPALERKEQTLNGARLRSFFRFMRWLISNLFSISLAMWFVLTTWVLGLAGSVPALALLSLIIGTIILKIALSLLYDIFPRHGMGLLDVLPDTAVFYRRSLMLLGIYLVFGNICFMIAGEIEIRNSTITLLWHGYTLGILIATLWISRTPHSLRLLAELPLPPWLQSITSLRIIQGFLASLIAAVVFTALFQFYVLSFYLSATAVRIEGILFLFFLLMLFGREITHVLIRPGHLLLKYSNLEEPQGQLRFSTLVEKIGKVLFPLGVLLSIIWALGISQSFLDFIGRALTWEIVLGSFRFTLLNIILALVIFYLVKWFARFNNAFLRLHLFPRTGWNPAVQYTIATILQYVIIAIGVILVLNVIGFPMANLVVVAGALGLGIGLGLQNLVANFVSGLILLIERPIKVGDMLVVDGQWGEVKEIRLRTTVFQTFDRYVLIIPNSELTSGRITNWTHYGRGPNRLSLKVGVSYGSDLKLVNRVLAEVCRSNPRVVKTPPPQIFFEAYGDSSLDFHIWVFVRTPDDRIPATHELNSAIFEAFAENGIEVPFPQRDLHLRSGVEGAQAGSVRST